MVDCGRLMMDSVMNGRLMMDSMVDCRLMMDYLMGSMVDTMMSSRVNDSMVRSGQSNVQKYDGHETLHLECS